MAKPLSFGKIEVGLTPSMEARPARLEPNTPFCVAILGDFSGHSNRGFQPSDTKVSARRPVLVDRDNFDEVLARHSVELRLGRIGKQEMPVTIQFKALDDFQPDRLFERVEILHALRQTRKRLENPATFAEAAAEVRSWAEKEAVHPPRAAQEPARQPSTTESNPLSVENLFDQMLEETQEQNLERRVAPGTVDWNTVLREITEPYTVPGTDPQLPEFVACADAAAAGLMRAILHHPDFQSIEAAWRALYFLVRRVETDSQLKLYLFDISKKELAADLGAAEDLSSTGTYKLLVEQTVGTPGADPWAILLGNYTFDHTREDAELVGRIGKIARNAGAAFVAAAGASLLRCKSLAVTPDPDEWLMSVDAETIEAWTDFRQLPEAAYVGLALPRFVLRLPYGHKTDPTEQFAFEEMTDDDHECYLWGNPAFACACLLAQAFSQHGWGFRPGSVQELDGLPVHVTTKDGEQQIKPCSEVRLTERAIEKISSLGLIALFSIRGQAVIRVASFRSIAFPGRQLAGRWSS